MDLMSQADYARHRGVTRQAVNKAIKAGKIHLREQAGRKGLDPAEADRAMGLNVSRVLAQENDDSDDAPPRQPDAMPSSGLTRARTATEVYKARIAELEYNDRLGKLRPVEDITIGAQRCAEVVLRAMSRISGRADEYAAMVAKDGVLGMRTVLRSVERDLRKVVAEAFAKLAAGETVEADDVEADQA